MDNDPRLMRVDGTTPDVTELRERANEANSELYRLWSKAHSRELLDSDDIRKFRIVLKSLGRRKHGAHTAEARSQLLSDYQGAIGSMRARLDEVFSVETAGESSIAKPATEEPRAATDEDPPSRGAGKSGPGVIVGGHVSEQQEWIDTQFKLVNLVKIRGYSPRDALEELEIPRSPRWARSLVRRYVQEGHDAFVDGRWTRTFERPVRTADLEKLVRVVINELPAAGPTAVWREVSRRCCERDWPEPSCTTVKRICGDIPPMEMAYLKGDDDLFKKSCRAVHRVELADYANERFQIDHCLLNVWIRIPRDTGWVAERPWITAILDVYSRSVAGYFLSTGCPDAMSISLAVQHAIREKDTPEWLNKGLPRVIQHDRGADFMSQAVTTWFSRAGIGWDPIPPRYPDANGKVERWFKTLDTSLLRRLPGHTAAVGTTEGAAAKRVMEFLTREQLGAEFEAWVITIYHETANGTTKEKPAERWERSVKLRMPEDDSIYRDMMLRANKIRRVTNEGIRFTVNGRGGRYWSPELAHHVGKDVVIEYSSELLESILVRDPATNELLAEAWTMDVDEPKYAIADVKRTRSQITKGLEARVEDYRQVVAVHDREKARKHHDETLLRELEEDPPEQLQKVGDEALEDLIHDLREGDRS